MRNAAYFFALISEVKKEAIVSEGIRRPVIKARCYDSENEISEISLIFSEVSDARKSDGLERGDVVYFQASVGECPKGELMFYPNKIHIIQKKSKYDNDDMSEVLFNSKLSPFYKEKNMVVFEGTVKEQNGMKVLLEIKGLEFTRGETSEYSYLWVISENFVPKIGSRVVFAGEVSGNLLKGNLCEIITE